MLGIALLVALGVAPIALVEILVNAGKISFWTADRWRSYRSTRNPQASGRPVEKIAADLRRLSAMVTDPDPMPAARRLGVRQAYDMTLVEACTALGIEQRLGQLTGVDQDLERLRVETAAQAAGLALRSPGRRHPHEQL